MRTYAEVTENGLLLTDAEICDYLKYIVTQCGCKLDTWTMT